MKHYSLAVSGVDGAFSATLTHDGATVDTASGFRTIQNARKWGRAAAAKHKEANAPSRLESYNEQFVV